MRTKQKAVQHVATALLDGPRVVTIWGAGTTIKCGVPGGYYIKEQLRAELRSVAYTEVFGRCFGAEQHEVRSRILGKNSTMSFEETLKLYAKIYSPRALHEWLRQYIPERGQTMPPYFPSFAQEFAAHLASSGLLQHFISLNFDEILEESLEEELGPEHVQVVSSTSDFERIASESRGRWPNQFGLLDPACIVLKPHGTISRPMTLCHLPEHTLSFGREKASVLRECLKEAMIVFLGFGNYNEDMWHLIGETYSRGLTRDIVIVDVNPEAVADKVPPKRATRTVHLYKGTVNSFCRDVTDRLHGATTRRVEPGRLSAHGLFQEREESRQRPTRHVIRSLFFDLFSRKLPTKKSERDYRRRHKRLETVPQEWFWRRIYEIELLIYLFKSRGLFVQLAVAECHRIRRAYLRCLQSSEKKESLEPSFVLEQILNRHDPPLVCKGPLHDRLQHKALNTHWIVLLLKPDDQRLIRADLEGLRREFTSLCDVAAERYVEHLSSALREARIRGFLGQEKAGKLAVKLSHSLSELLRDFDVDITSMDLSTAMRFQRAEMLHSRTELYRHTKNLLSRQWRVLHVATVSGEWLVGEIERLAEEQRYPYPREIHVLSNLDMFMPKCKDQAVGNEYHYVQMGFSIARLLDAIRAWEDTIVTWTALQNLQHHMTIASGPVGSDGKELPLGAIYFRRPGKNTSISPVFLPEAAQDDLCALMDYFRLRSSAVGDGSFSTVSRVLRARATAKGTSVTALDETTEFTRTFVNPLIDFIARIGSNIEVESHGRVES